MAKVARRARRIRICKEEDCQNAQTTAGYCRLHYLRNWKRLKEEKQKVSAERLNKYVDRMSRRFPGRYVDEIKKELRRGVFEDGPAPVDDEAEAFSSPFAEAEYKEEIDQLLHDLKIEKDF